MKLFRAFSFPQNFHTLPKSVRSISLMMLFYYLGWGLVEPFLPIYFKEVLGSYTNVSYVAATLYLFSIILSFPYGELTDIVSRRALMRIILFLYLPLGPLLSVLQTLFHFMTFRAYHAFLSTGLWSSVESYVRFHSPRKKASRSIGFLDAAVGLSAVIGALAGGIWVTVFDIKSMFFLMPIFTFVGLLVVLRLPDHHGTSNVAGGVSTLFKTGIGRIFSMEFTTFWRLPGMPLITYLSFIINAVYVSTLILLPLVSDALGATPWQVGLIYAVFLLPVIFEAPFSVLADTMNKRNMLVLGGILAVAVQVGMLFMSNLYGLFVLSLLLALAFALINPVIEGMVTNNMPHRHIGEMNGVYRSFVLAASAVGALVIGPIADKFTIQTPFLIGALFMLVFVAATLLFPSYLLRRA